MNKTKLTPFSDVLRQTDSDRTKQNTKALHVFLDEELENAIFKSQTARAYLKLIVKTHFEKILETK